MYPTESLKLDVTSSCNKWSLLSLFTPANFIHSLAVLSVMLQCETSLTEPKWYILSLFSLRRAGVCIIAFKSTSSYTARAQKQKFGFSQHIACVPILLICLYSHRSVPPKLPKLLSHPSHYLNLRDQEPNYSMIIYYSFLVVQKWPVVTMTMKFFTTQFPVNWNLQAGINCKRQTALPNHSVSKETGLNAAWAHSSVAPWSWLLVSRTHPGIRNLNWLEILPLLWLLKLLRVNHSSSFTGKVDEYSKLKWYWRWDEDASQDCWPVKE